MGSKIEKLKKERRWEEVHVIGEAEHAQSFSKVLNKKPKNSEEYLLHRLWQVGNKEEQHMLAHMLVKLAKDQN